MCINLYTLKYIDEKMSSVSGFIKRRIKLKLFILLYCLLFRGMKHKLNLNCVFVSKISCL
jgi:hypothetical protein